jgi:hypothetical protein
MNRRTFVASLAATPLVARIPDLQSLLPHAERRFKPVSGSGHLGWIQVEVQLAMTEREARGLRNREAHDPFDGLIGEFYIDDAHPVEIADHLPGTLTTYETIVGVAAERGIVHTGGFRRGSFVWTVRVSGDIAWAIEVAEWIVALDLPDESRVRLAPSLAQTLLPVENDFSIKVRIDET